MPRIDETTFVLHGLDQDNRIVRAAVFAQKLTTLVKALRVADKIVNGKNAFDYVISNLGTGSAAITVREKQRTRRQHNHSSIAYFETVAVAVYNGDRSIEHLPAPVIKQVEKLGNGAAIKFSHAELAFSDDTVIRIDDYLLHQSEAALEIVSEPNRKIVNNFYRGLTRKFRRHPKRD
jgi:hypothetical protein